MQLVNLERNKTLVYSRDNNFCSLILQNVLMNEITTF
jgi:hypothetical protein